MTSTQTNRSEYARRMNRVLDHIDRNLDTSLELAALADVAHFSSYHFHRVFAAWMGETLGDYLRRRRLECGALKLAARSDTPVLEIALSVGFGSGEAFARAFKLQFGCTPSAWRTDTTQRWAAQLERARGDRVDQHRNPDQVMRNPDQVLGDRFGNHEVPQPLVSETDMDVRLLDLPAARIAYMRHIGPYGTQIGALWEQRFVPWMTANQLHERIRYGIGHDDPSITPPEKCRYDACVEVPDNFVPNGQVSVATLPGGRYAVAQFKGTSATIGNAWVEMFRDWLPASGFQCDGRPCFERYLKESNFDPVTRMFDCELCIPIAAL